VNSTEYQNYTFRQLYEALDSIRGDIYPESLERLETEIRSRTDAPKAELEEAYFRLDHDRYPEHKTHLAALIQEQGGFDTIAPEAITDENRYQTGWRRFWALFFDSTILQLIISALTVPLMSARPGDVVTVTVISFCSQILVLFYFILMHASWGQTLGKMITGVRVVRVSDEQPINLLRSLLRDSVPVVFLVTAILMLPYSDIVVVDGKTAMLKPPAISTGVGLLALLWGAVEIVSMLFSKKRRALHDLIAGTVVVRYVRTQKHGRKDIPGDALKRGQPA
jgi:uncharacterized RDD family membrane protein YckC